MQIISVKTRGYRHKYHPTLLSIELLLQLQTIVTNVLRLSYFDNYLSKLAFSTYFTIYSKMATTTTRTWHLFEHIELLSQLKTTKWWLSFVSIAAPISHRRQIWKGKFNQNMKWPTSDVKGVNSQQLAKISLENILTQSIIRKNSSA